ncbi:hypothetical protein Dimus_011266, partial [Dionaea muscipula]
VGHILSAVESRWICVPVEDDCINLSEVVLIHRCSLVFGFNGIGASFSRLFVAIARRRWWVRGVSLHLEFGTRVDLDPVILCDG